MTAYYYIVSEGYNRGRKFHATRIDDRDDAISFANASPASYVEVREYRVGDSDSEGEEILRIKN